MSVILNGSSQYLTGAIVAPVDEGTISIFVKRTVASSDDKVVFDTDAARHQVTLSTTLSKVVKTFNDSKVLSFAGAQEVDAVSWHHILVGYKKSLDSVVAYVDGVALTGTPTGAWGSTAASTQITLGARFSQDQSHITARLAEFALYNRLLLPGQVGALTRLSSPMNVQRSNLAVYYKLNGNLVPTVGTVTLTNGGAATFDTADNPTVRSRRAGSGFGLGVGGL